MPWKELIHEGVSMPPTYKPKGFITYPKGVKFPLKKEAEEYLVYWFQIGTEHQSDTTTLNNFLYCICNIQKNINNEMLKDHNVKAQFEKLTKNFIPSPKVSNEVKFNGKIVKVNNTVERPSIFLGRGNHPLRGMIKPKIRCEDITINWSGSSKGPSGKKWGKVISDRNSTWIACWKDTLANKIKYIHLNAVDNKNKFKDAQILKGKINGIMNKVNKDILSPDNTVKQLATIVYIVYKTGIRIGHEKDENSSDSVGCCTLSIDNVKLKPNNTIELSFNGKDYIPFQSKLKLPPVYCSVIYNLLKNKKSSEQIFTVSASRVNDYLGKLMPNLTAKVFRTFRASKICSDSIKGKRGLDELKEAFIKVAKFCNHKKMLKGKYVTEVGTCKKNYIDPRIVYSYCKKQDIDISNVYSPELQRIHNWASLTSKTFVY